LRFALGTKPADVVQLDERAVKFAAPTPAESDGAGAGMVAHHRLQVYLDESVFRFNRRAADSRGLLFHRLLVQVLKNGPIPRSRL
jgi:hypothetical protein